MTSEASREYSGSFLSVLIFTLCILTPTSCESPSILIVHSSSPPRCDLAALRQGRATEELVLSVVSLASRQGQGGHGARSGSTNHSASRGPSKSPINWSDCPADWKRELCAFPSLACFSLSLTFQSKTHYEEN